jgi:hypothetical protein
MDDKVRPAVNGHEDSPGYEWRWWYNVLGLANVLAIVIVMSW